MDQKHLQCSNCLKEIEESKLDLHEAYCRRNIFRCQECGNMVDVNEKEMHIQECKKYKKEETYKSPVQIEEYKRCPYCQIDVNQCGSRTTVCEYCKQNILVRLFEFHEPVCQQELEQNGFLFGKKLNQLEKQYPSSYDKEISKIQNNKNKGSEFQYSSNNYTSSYSSQIQQSQQNDFYKNNFVEQIDQEQFYKDVNKNNKGNLKEAVKKFNQFNNYEQKRIKKMEQQHKYVKQENSYKQVQVKPNLSSVLSQQEEDIQEYYNIQFQNQQLYE